jgi:hypothetical protein
MIGAGAVLLVVCVMAAAMLLAARESSSPSTTAAGAEPAEASVAAVDAKPPAAAAAAMPRAAATPAAATAAKAAAAKSSTMTITGCLQRGNDAFRLTDTDGSDAPRTRSWKTGFLKKGPAAIDVVDPGNRLKMASHVGQRVSVTGLLEERQMQVRSLRRIAPSCE